MGVFDEFFNLDYFMAIVGILGGCVSVGVLLPAGFFFLGYITEAVTKWFKSA